MSQAAVLVLEDGSVFHGESIGYEGQAVGEVVFNTGMSGYQEILTDPSYACQMVTLTCPHIGNVGVNHEDEESEKIWASGLIVRDYCEIPSNWRSQHSLKAYLHKHKIVAISEIDTRRLTRLLREKGAQRGCISTDAKKIEAALTAAREFPGLDGMDLAKVVSVKKSYEWKESSWQLGTGHTQHESTKLPYHIVAYDFGVKRNMLRLLVDRGCRITVVPAQTPASEILALKPAGILLSNGPGDPAACDYAIVAIRELLEKQIPLLGICLGFQLLALASGAKTIKMKFGHHGANHPVQNMQTGQVFISSQNHGFTVDENTLADNIKITHRSLFDNTLQGLRWLDKPVLAFQGHPEASPGPHDITSLFDEFIALMK